MKRLCLAVFGVLLVSAPALADCDHFEWSVAREVAWFKGSPSACPRKAERPRPAPATR